MEDQLNEKNETEEIDAINVMTDTKPTNKAEAPRFLRQLQGNDSD